MLETVALCSVLFDFSGLWLGFLPEQMKNEIHAEIGFDPWGDEIKNVMINALGAAAESDGKAAWMALHAAEKAYDLMSPETIVSETLACAERYSFVSSK